MVHEHSVGDSIGSLVGELRIAISEAERASFPSFQRVLDHWRSELEHSASMPAPTRALNEAVRAAAAALETWRAVRSW